IQSMFEVLKPSEAIPNVVPKKTESEDFVKLVRNYLSENPIGNSVKLDASKMWTQRIGKRRDLIEKLRAISGQSSDSMIV
ncbi:unnamed protein product, partial [Caenorhabditis auriculariae]